MSFRSMLLVLPVCAAALIPSASLAGPAADVAASSQVASLAPSKSVLDISIEEISSTLAGCAILDRDFPGLRTHTMYRAFRTMSLNQIAAMSHGEITAEMLAQARTDLAVLPVAVTARNVRPPDIKDLDFDSPSGQGAHAVNAPK